MMDKTINAAIQVLPQSAGKHTYEIIDNAIRLVRDSGLQHRVCPFETVVEGNYDEVIRLITGIRDICFTSGAEEILINLKLHIHQSRDIRISDKMEKYSNNK